MSAVPAISIAGLSRSFGRTVALDGVDLEVAEGCVYGLLGENGAGKTTLVKHLLGLLRAKRGTVRVFGRDPVADPAAVLAEIGYLAENHELPDWLRLDEYLRYLEAFYPAWDRGHAAELCRSFELDPARKLGKLSKGQRARAALVGALAYRPRLLILDEPSSGLDPLARCDLLEAVIRSVVAEGLAALSGLMIFIYLAGALALRAALEIPGPRPAVALCVGGLTAWLVCGMWWTPGRPVRRTAVLAVLGPAASLAIRWNRHR